MLETATAERLIHEHFDRFRALFGLEGWTMRVQIAKLERDTAGDFYTDPGRKRVTIRLDPSEIEDEAEFVQVLRHEFVHAMLWPFNHYAVTLGPGTLGEDAWRELRDFTQERLVRAVEDLLGRLEAE